LSTLAHDETDHEFAVRRHGGMVPHIASHLLLVVLSISMRRESWGARRAP
jgi:hypothetical protein